MVNSGSAVGIRLFDNQGAGTAPVQVGARFPCPAKTASKPRRERDFSNTLPPPLTKGGRRMVY
jgi:hypothetical protein